MTHINQRRDTASNWTLSNPVLQLGEVGWERGVALGDPWQAKVGDGETAWNDLSYSVTSALSFAPINSPAFTGNPTAPTPAPGDDDTSVATTAFVNGAIASGISGKANTSDVEMALNLKAQINNPTFTGNPSAPTPATSDNDTSIATTAFVKAALTADKASPTFTGDPKAPTPATSDNDTSIATTAFVKAAILASHPVGCIYMGTVNTNPASFLGGTWIAWGSGRVPVGVDASQTEFDTTEETGGSKTTTLSEANLPTHNHGPASGSRFVTTTRSGPPGQRSGTAWSSGAYVPAYDAAEAVASTASTENVGSGTAVSNLQPYITCYMWKRTG